MHTRGQGRSKSVFGKNSQPFLTTRSSARSLLVDLVACAVAVRFVDEMGGKKGGAEAAARSRRAMERCTRGAKAVAKLLLEKIFSLFSQPRRERWRRNTLA